MSLPKTAQIDALFQSILQLKDEEECRRYFEDLCTIKEVQALAQRLEIARRLDSYLNTVEHTGASSATVSRVNRCLEYGAGGYRFILDRLPKLEENT